MPLNKVFLRPQNGLDKNPITKALLPPSRFELRLKVDSKTTEKRLEIDSSREGGVGGGGR